MEDSGLIQTEVGEVSPPDALEIEENRSIFPVCGENRPRIRRFARTEGEAASGFSFLKSLLTEAFLCGQSRFESPHDHIAATIS